MLNLKDTLSDFTEVIEKNSLKSSLALIAIMILVNSFGAWSINRHFNSFLLLQTEKNISDSERQLRTLEQTIKFMTESTFQREEIFKKNEELENLLKSMDNKLTLKINEIDVKLDKLKKE